MMELASKSRSRYSIWDLLPLYIYICIYIYIYIFFFFWGGGTWTLARGAGNPRASGARLEARLSKPVATADLGLQEVSTHVGCPSFKEGHKPGYKQ